mgnify:CR=1 FL=1
MPCAVCVSVSVYVCTVCGVWVSVSESHVHVTCDHNCEYEYGIMVSWYHVFVLYQHQPMTNDQ